MFEMKEIKLKDGDVVKFKPFSSRLGRAEFAVCPIYKRGILKKILLYPVQQKDMNLYYSYTFEYKPISWSISSWGHKNIEHPKIWNHYWCKEHNCLGFRLYVPKESNCFTVSTLSTFSIYFDYKT